MKHIDKLLAGSIPLVLLSACAGGPPEKPETAAVVAQAQPVCFEDTPTGTRFSRVKCFTAEEQKLRLKAGQDAADELRQIRAMPQDQK